MHRIQWLRKRTVYSVPSVQNAAVKKDNSVQCAWCTRKEVCTLCLVYRKQWLRKITMNNVPMALAWCS